MAPIIGIDLGTTNSLVAYVADDGSPQIIVDENEGALVPSFISFNEKNEPVVGVYAKEHSVENVDRTVYSVKRLMGRSYNDVKTDSHLISYRFLNKEDGLIRVQVGEKFYTPIELSAMILSKLKHRAENFFGEPVSKAVITVPAYFNDSQRQATRDAGKLAGLDVLRIVNEPTAASLSYGLEKKGRGIVFEVLSTNGNTYLGGDDVDKNIMETLIEEITAVHDMDFKNDRKALQQVKKSAENLKITLSASEKTDISIHFENHDIRFESSFTRKKLETLARPVINITQNNCRQAMKDASIKPEVIDAIILVGGMTRMPLVREIVRETFLKEPFSDINPDEIVALGAAIQANILSGNKKDMLLLDVNPLSLGIETVGGVMSVLIPRNTTIPNHASELFTTFVDNQTGIDIHVLQGERDLVKDNRSLARFQLKGIQPQPAGMPKIEVTFQIDANGILNVGARDKHTGQEASVDVKPSYGLTDEEVEKMLMESLEHAEEDVRARMLVDAQNEANVLLKATKKVLVEHPDVVNETERKTILKIAAELEDAITRAKTDIIRRKTDELNKTTEKLAKTVMDTTVKKILSEKKIDDVDEDLR